TLGIAAGSGYTSRYRGMAFDSDICLVSNAVSDDYELIDSTDYYKYTTATDALGFKYIFDYADSQSKPCVISFSEGYYFGYSGEDSLFCEYLTGLTGPGHIIVASAGNESQYVGYLCKPSGADEAGSFLYSNGNSATYYVQSRDAFHMCFLTYGTSEIDTLTIESSQCSTDYTTSVFSFVQKDTGAECRLSIDRYPSSFIVGDTVYCVSIESDVTISSLSPIALVLTGTQSEVSARGVSSSMFANGLADDKWNDAEISHNVLAPGCFDGIITVGATIHRTSFTNYLGNYCEYPQAGRNDGVRSYYSSIGPGVDGNIKPDIVAPGDNIVSSYSSFYLEANPNANDKSFDIAYFDYNGRTYLWHSSTGTSMSTPVVAGAIALWLQAKPDLTPEEIIDVFSRTSRKPETELSYPNNYYGYGEIDVYKGLLDILGISGIKEISKSQPSSVHVSIDESGTMILTFDSVPQNDVDVSVYSISGTLLYKDTISPTGSFTVRKTMLSIPESIVIVQLKGIDKGVTGSTIIRK
ncbi:MAG: S8 family serine peptidase, partial [Prevotellaceae bacterium]|nr:S8 family serine peptidase [Prevotellaceae bacterium]